MGFRLSDEREALRKTAEQFAREVVAPAAAVHDRSQEFLNEVVR